MFAPHVITANYFSFLVLLILNNIISVLIVIKVR